MDERVATGVQYWAKRRPNFRRRQRRHHRPWRFGKFLFRGLIGTLRRVIVNRSGLRGCFGLRSRGNDNSLSFDENVIQLQFLEDLSDGLVHTKARKIDAYGPICQFRRNAGLHSCGLIPKLKQAAYRSLLRIDGDCLVELHLLRSWSGSKSSCHDE